MKKYIVFCYDYYYPNGGLDDIITSCDTIEEARKILAKENTDVKMIVDRDTWKEIETKR